MLFSQPAIRRCAHCSVGESRLSRYIEAITFISMPRAKNIEISLGRQAADALGVGDEVAVAVADDGADVGVAAGGVGLHLAPQVRVVAAQEQAVGLADRGQRLLAALPLGGALEDLQRPP